MAISYRPIGNEYSTAVIDLILPIQQQEFNVPTDISQQQDLLNIDQFYHGTGGGFWGAFDGDQLVGTIALIAYAPDGGALRKMFVRKTYRGKELGIATALLDTLLAYADKQGIRHIYLGTVNFLHAARRFYEKKGFDEVTADQLPAAFPRMAVDDVFYHYQS
ncbi:GNAT family N-acetyltransferase [Chitinophaga qingshengii]|uniref:GNAT family N-acetyltransferase n=1 Tax=Chitinophaga qingshengii TaxID=1569794 RepID=A0ABR7TRZ9_9BACT|nr:GNAT family N-acetyltransferase [Chitinophaga qingshengii]MBC9933256.1 GNAT family N-acetyltransferase [Chitinophaga qingshengii]